MDGCAKFVYFVALLNPNLAMAADGSCAGNAASCIASTWEAHDHSSQLQTKLTLADTVATEEDNDRDEEYQEEDDEEEDEDEEIIFEKGSGACNKQCSKQRGFFTLSNTGATKRKLEYYRPKGSPFLGKTSSITRAVLVFHGIGHNPDKYMCYAHNSMPDDLDDSSSVQTYALGLYDKAKIDTTSSSKRKKSAIYWNHFTDWMFGVSKGDFGITSYSVIDEVVKKLLDKKRYPDLQDIVFLGHGGGAQVVDHYAALNSVDTQSAGVKMKYVIGNPSIILYLTAQRPKLPASMTEIKSKGCSYFDAKTVANKTFTMEEPDAHQTWVQGHGTKSYTDSPITDDCSAYDTYPFGLIGAPTTRSQDDIKKQYSSRHLVFLASDGDTCNLNLQKGDYANPLNCGFCCEVGVVMDTGTCTLDHHEVKYPLNARCQAMLQGLTRLERIYGHLAYMNALFGSKHNHSIVDVSGKHNGCLAIQDDLVAGHVYK